MKKRIISVISLIMISFFSMSIDTIAAQVKVKGTIIKGVLEEENIDSELDDNQNVYIDLPTTEFKWDIDETENGAISVDNSIATCAITSTSVSSYASISGARTRMESITTLNSDKVKYNVEKAFSTKFTRTVVNAEGVQTSESYKFGDKVMTSFTTPGLTYTNVNGNVCCDMTPQGIDYVNGYIFITAYCSNSGKHNSVIYVLDRSTKKYITTLVMENTCHAGGITYANGYLWVNGSTASNGLGRLYYYKYSEVVTAIEYAQKNASVTSISLSNCTRGVVYLEELDKSSCISTYNGYLVVGEYEEYSSGEIGIYEPIAENGSTLEAKKTFDFISRMQGLEFYTLGMSKHMIVTTSWSSILNSTIYVYDVTSEVSGEITYKKKITMPCMVEGVMVCNGYPYFVYESAASKYRDEATLIVDKVCGMSASFLFK